MAHGASLHLALTAVVQRRSAPAACPLTTLACCTPRCPPPGDCLYAAHAGDSRAVLCRGGAPVRLTEDHKPNLATERARVEAAGGRVEFQRCWRVVVEPRDGRPGSGLAVSR